MDGQTDGRTEAIALPPSLMWSAIIITNLSKIGGADPSRRGVLVGVGSRCSLGLCSSRLFAFYCCILIIQDDTISCDIVFTRRTIKS